MIKMNFPCLLDMLAFCPVPLTLSSCVVSGGAVLREAKSREHLSSSDDESDEGRVSARKRSRSASVSKKIRSRSASVSKKIRSDAGKDARSSASGTKTSRISFSEGQFDNCLFDRLIVILQ